MLADKIGPAVAAFLGLAGNAPAYSIAVTTWVLIAASGSFSPAMLLYCGILILGIAASYRRLNSRRISGGAAFTWVSEVVHPAAGFVAGWCLLVASALFLISASLPAAQALLSLAGFTVEGKLTVSALAICIVLVLSIIVASGIRIAGRIQSILTAVEVGILIVLLGWIFVLHGTDVLALDWSSIFLLRGASVSQISQGIVVAMFFYWGWDVVFNASEETRDAAKNSGFAAFAAIAVLILLFVSFALTTLAVVSEDMVKSADGNLLLALARQATPPSLISTIVFAFLISTIGAIQASFIQFSQTVFAQAKSGYFHSLLTRTSTSGKAPIYAIALDACVALLLLGLSLLSSTVEEVIAASISASAILVTIYYGLTGVACIVQAHRESRSKLAALRLSVFPGISVLALLVAAALAAGSFSLLTITALAFTLALGIFLYLMRSRFTRDGAEKTKPVPAGL